MIKQETGYMNKFSTSTSLDDYIEHIDGISIDSLVEKYGSPLFVFSEKQNTGKLSSNEKRLHDSLP